MMIHGRNILNASRRSGGREARRTLRAAPPAKDLRPVRAGLEGGHFKPLDAEAVKSIDATVHQILEEIGLSQAPVLGLEYTTGAGPAGATVPASIAGAVGQALSEVIAGLIYGNAI